MTTLLGFVWCFEWTGMTGLGVTSEARHPSHAIHTIKPGAQAVTLTCPLPTATLVPG